MGNELAYYGGRRAQEAQHYGNVYLQLNQDAVLPDDTVTGTIYLDMHKPYPGDKVCLKIKGKEHTKWIDKETRYRARPDGTQEAYTVDIPREAQVEVLKQISDVYDWRQGAVIPPGQYSFPLSFKIPNGLPGSFFLRNGTALAEIGYEIQAFLVPEARNCPKIKFKRPLTVRQNLSTMIQTKEISTTRNVTTWCCVSQGSVSMKTYFEKNAYAPSEVARVVTEVDNSKCQVAVQDLSFQFLQNVTLHADGHSKTFTFVIRSVSLGRIEAGQAFINENRKEASIQLPPGQSGRMKDYRGNTIEHYDLDPTQALTPSTHGRLVNSQFSLRVTSSMEGCTCCCDESPSNDLPVQVYAVVQKTIPPPVAPMNWNPQRMPPVIISVNVGSPVIISVNDSSSVQINNQMPMQSQGARVMPLPQPQPQQTMNVGMNTSMNSTAPLVQPHNMSMSVSPGTSQRADYGMPNNNVNVNMNMYGSSPMMNNSMPNNNMNYGMPGIGMNNGMPNNNVNVNMNVYGSGPMMNNNMPNNNMNYGMPGIGMNNGMSSHNSHTHTHMHSNFNVNNNMSNNNTTFGMRGMDNSMPSYNASTNMNKSSNEPKPKPNNNGLKISNVQMEADPNTNVNHITKMDVNYGVDVPNPFAKITGNKNMHLDLKFTVHGDPPPKHNPAPNTNPNPNPNPGPTPATNNVMANNETNITKTKTITSGPNTTMPDTMPNTNINMNMNVGMNDPNPMMMNNDMNNQMQGGFQMPQNYNMTSTYSETRTQNGMTVTETQSYNQTMNNPINNDTNNQGMFQMPQNYNATSAQNEVNTFESQSYNQAGGMDMNMNMGMNVSDPTMNNGMGNMNMNMNMGMNDPMMDNGMGNMNMNVNMGINNPDPYNNGMDYGMSTQMQDTYQAPQETYQPPQETYQPPQETYQPPQETYQPPQETYQPPQETYQPPQETYQPPQEEPAPQEGYQVYYEDA